MYRSIKTLMEVFEISEATVKRIVKFMQTHDEFKDSIYVIGGSLRIEEEAFKLAIRAREQERAEYSVGAHT